MECNFYYGIEKYTFRRTISDFGVDFLYFSLFFQRHFQSCLSYRPLTRSACTLYYLIGNRVFIIFECCLTLTIHKNGGGVTFHNSGYRLALGHVNDMRCLGKSTCTSKLQKKTRIWNTTDILIKMLIIYLWCKEASWLLILCALCI